MKIALPGLSKFLTLIFSFFVFSAVAETPKNGILPLTGLKFFCEGINVHSMDVLINGAQLMSNRIPLNREIEITMQQPAGFTADSRQVMFAGAEVTILSPRGEVLLQNPNVLLQQYSKGFNAGDLKNFSIKFGIGADLMKGNFNGLVKIRLFDLKSKNQLRMDFPVTFAKPGEPLQVSKTTKTISSNYKGVVAVISGLQAKNLQVKVDTSIKVAPRMAYTSLDISKIEGSSLTDIFQGKENFWVYDSNLNEVKITEILLKQVKSAMENNFVDYTLKIPYRVKFPNPDKLYTVRFRWESADKSQVIDVVVNI